MPRAEGMERDASWRKVNELLHVTFHISFVDLIIDIFKFEMSR